MSINNRRGPVSETAANCQFFGGCLRALTDTRFLFAAEGENFQTADVSWTGPNVFSGEQTILFNPIFSDGLLDVSGTGGFGQMPGTQQFAALSVRRNGEWQEVSRSASGAEGQLSSLWPDVSFQAGTIDGLRLSHRNRLGLVSDSVSLCNSFQGCFRNMAATAFTFRVPAAVPEPSTWAMLVFGFGIIGGGLRGRAGVRNSARALILP